MGGIQGSLKVSAESSFDRDCYTARYSDLRHMNETDAKKHFLDHGILEGRDGACNFDCKCYLNRYSDLKGAYGTNCTKGLSHWKNSGIKEGRTAWCKYKTPAIASTPTPYSNGCVTSDSLKNLENDYVAKVAGSQRIEAWKGQATVYNDGLSTADSKANCGFRNCSDPKYAWNTQTSFIDGVESCVYSQCALGTNTYLAGGAITKKPDVSSGCSYYHTGQFPFDPQTCSDLNVYSPQEREDCAIDSFGSGGYVADKCQCITNTTCPSGRTETSCGNVGSWNNRDYYLGRKRSLLRRSLHRHRRRRRRPPPRPPPPPPPPPPKNLMEWVSAGKVLNGNCCVYKRSMFNCTCYRNRYSDLKRAFGSNCGRAWPGGSDGLEGHYRKSGIREGRN